MPPAPRALALTCLLLAAALAGRVVPARAAPVRTDGQRARPARALPAGPAVARAAVSQRSATDPRLVEQWSLDGDGPMGIASAWSQTTGGPVTVAIVDSGIDLGHPDLVPNLWSNSGEIVGNGIDDDANGYVDDVHGYDFVAGDPVPQDENGHGTHVAGIVAARGGNGIGISGTAWQARLMAVRVLDDRATGTTETVAAGVRYAADNGARIINLSLAGPSSSADLEAAIADATARGVLVVAAAGNAGRDLAKVPAYPASYALPGVVGVAASDERGRLATISDYGPGADLAAPGQDILSTALGGGYEWRTGTSMAAPAVTGAAVLLAAERPDLDASALRDALLGSARRTGLPVEAGALDVGAALRIVIPAVSWRAPAPAAAGARATARTPGRSGRARIAHRAAHRAGRRVRASRARHARAQRRHHRRRARARDHRR
ncbi:MAG TPA: S8 family peptidase [Baekduia sp.]|nr:S8 family peptidase [Baekduia sp.]